MAAAALWDHRNLASRTLKIRAATPGNNDLEAMLHAENSLCRNCPLGTD